MAGAGFITVEVAYAAPRELFLERVTLPRGSTVAEAIERSGFPVRHPDVPLAPGNVGVFSRKVGLEHVVEDDDRVEIYRPLELTPNEIRKLRAARRKATGGPGKRGASSKRSVR